MAKSVTFTSAAEADSDNGYFWYESKRIGLGRAFLVAVDASIQSICRNPESYPIIYKTYRRAIVRRFPYAIFYEVTATEIIVYAVFDCRQAPERWRERLQ
jgi:plasmid stabilization system protein ParE